MTNNYEVKSLNRRDFMKFFGFSTAAMSSISSLVSCTPDALNSGTPKAPIFGISPSDKDALVLADGLKYDILIGHGDKINDQDAFGFNNDYINYVELSSDNILLWVNHEYPHPLFVSGWDMESEKLKSHVDLEMKALGGSIIELKKVDQKWEVVKDSKFNRRLDAFTKIPFARGVEIQSQNYAIGTFANCAGGKTPWGTILTCEENFHDFYGDVLKSGKQKESTYGWDKYYPVHHPHHYGWVVEVDLKTGSAKKHTSIGRFAHECCTVTFAKNGKVVAYSGDDKGNEFVYRFVSSTNNSLDEGELFVADLENGKWLSLDINKSDILKKNFKDQLDVQIHAREAGKLLGATPCDRPEDIEIHPITGEVFICMTNNYKPKDLSDTRNNFYGKILKISPKNSDHGDIEFVASDFLLGSETTGIACPDNLVFDQKGNIWLTNDISGTMMNHYPYTSFKNNGLFFIPTSGKNAGLAFQVASAPKDAELTGPCFSSDYKTLFLSVQHPGEKSESLSSLTSHWPDGGNAKPRPCVVQIYGDFNFPV